MRRVSCGWWPTKRRCFPHQSPCAQGSWAAQARPRSASLPPSLHQPCAVVWVCGHTSALHAAASTRPASSSHAMQRCALRWQALSCHGGKRLLQAPLARCCHPSMQACMAGIGQLSQARAATLVERGLAHERAADAACLRCSACPAVDRTYHPYPWLYVCTAALGCAAFVGVALRGGRSKALDACTSPRA